MNNLPAGVIYLGHQDDARGGSFALYNDETTRTTFAVSAGETIEQALQRNRQQFGLILPASPPTQSMKPSEIPKQKGNNHDAPGGGDI